MVGTVLDAVEPFADGALLPTTPNISRLSEYDDKSQHTICGLDLHCLAGHSLWRRCAPVAKTGNTVLDQCCH